MTSGRNFVILHISIFHIGENQDVQSYVGWQAWIENHMFVMQSNPVDEKNGCNQKIIQSYWEWNCVVFLVYNQAKRLCSQRMHTLQT